MKIPALFYYEKHPFSSKNLLEKEIYFSYKSERFSLNFPVENLFIENFESTERENFFGFWGELNQEST